MFPLIPSFQVITSKSLVNDPALDSSTSRVTHEGSINSEEKSNSTDQLIINRNHQAPSINKIIATNLAIFPHRYKHRIQMMRKVSLILSLLATTTNAFVVTHNSPLTRAVGMSSLNAFDPAHIFEGAISVMADASDAADAVTSSSDYIPGTSGEVSYSRASYYTILGLYLLSFPGLFSTISRSTKAKVKRKTFVT